jgi:Gas vesicle protein G
VPVILVDDILLAPFHGLLWIFAEIHRAAQEEMVGDAESITAELSTLYMRLETGKITEQEFAEQEKVLLDRLDKIQGPERMIE